MVTTKTEGALRVLCPRGYYFIKEEKSYESKQKRRQAIHCLVPVVPYCCGMLNGEKTTTKAEPSAPEQPQPVTLTAFTSASNGSLEAFMKQFGDDIQKKFPYVSFDYVGGLNWETEIPVVLGSNKTIDFVVVQAISYNTAVKAFDLQLDISDLIKSHKYALSAIQPSIIEGMLGLSPERKLYGLAVSTSNFALMYTIKTCSTDLGWRIRETA